MIRVAVTSTHAQQGSTRLVEGLEGLLGVGKAGLPAGGRVLVDDPFRDRLVDLREGLRDELLDVREGLLAGLASDKDLLDAGGDGRLAGLWVVVGGRGGEGDKKAPMGVELGSQRT